jgi:hypothetical protein
MKTVLWIACSAGMALSCVSYEAAPVKPLFIAQDTLNEPVFGKVRTPKVMFLVDRSGSMNDPINSADPDCNNCGSNGPACNPSVCPTRWSEMRAAMSSFFTQYDTLARYGFLFFPHPQEGLCAPPALTSSGGLVAELPSFDAPTTQLSAVATQIRGAINAAIPGGGTPTGASLSLLHQYTPLMGDDFSDGFVVLVTDGLPNCNDANPANSEVPGSGCTCVLTNCQRPYQRMGCLDEGATVAGVRSLRDAGIRTFVLGLGSELTSPDAFRVLNAMAEEGGMARSCSGGRSCAATETCDPSTLLCSRRYYASDNGAQLAADLADAISRVPAAPCELHLDWPLVDEELVSVFLDGQLLNRDQFHYEPTPSIVIDGAACERIKAADVSDGLRVEIRAVYPR